MRQPGASPQEDSLLILVSAESAKCVTSQHNLTSIPNITLVVVDLVSLQELPVFILERSATMMLLLSMNVLLHRFDL